VKPAAPRALFSLAVVLAAGVAHLPSGKVSDFFSRDGRMRGACFVAGGPVGESAFAPLLENNVEWISQTPFGYAPSLDAPRIELATRGRIYWGETDEGIAATTRLAKKFGIRTLLKPHVWIGGWDEAAWSGEIRMRTEADWSRWFDSYRAFLLHYAELAEKHKIEALAVGTELQGTTLAHEKEWRALIARVRRVYSGRLTYAANWNHEFEELPFWDALDFAGVQAYFPLTERPRASMPELLAGWRPHLEMLERVAQRIRRPIVFTEVGYKSSERASIQPWLWRTEDRVDLEEQARCYEAMFRSVWGKPWFRGTFIWKWFPLYDRTRSATDNNFTPQGKPAEEVLGRWYRQADLAARPHAPS
jgi:hypothetical protein